MNRMKIYEILLVFLIITALFTSFFLIVLDNRTSGNSVESNINVTQDSLNYGR